MVKWRLVNRWFGKDYGESKFPLGKLPDPSEFNTSSNEVYFSLQDLRDISNSNVDNAVDFLDHRFHWASKGLSSEVYESNVKSRDLEKVILNPANDLLVEMGDEDLREVKMAVETSGDEMQYEDVDIKEYVKQLEEERDNEFKQSELLKRQKNAIFQGRYQNFYFVERIEEGSIFESNLIRAGVRCALLLTDTFYTRDTDFYKRIVKILEKNKISFVEFTNVQPKLDRKTIFRISEFANDHDVNALIAIGSMSTVELSKLLIAKLVKPNIIRLHKTRAFDLALAAKYSLFSIPTFVVPDPKINSRSAVRNHIMMPKWDFFGNTLYLKSEIDDADAVIYCWGDVFDTLSRDKVIETLHETFFKLVFSYFDLSASEELSMAIVENIKRIESLLDVMQHGQDLTREDRKELVKIISFTMDGRTIVDIQEFWLLYKLEGALSLLVNSKKSDGLALFMPIFFEVLSEKSLEFNKRALKFAEDMYGAYSVEGCIYKLSMHIRKYGLPVSLLDIEQVRKVDDVFLSELMKKARLGSQFSYLSKTIVKRLRTF